MSKNALLITGATGKQGSATINALISAGALSTFTILAATRNLASSAAKQLQSRGVIVIEGDLNDCEAIFERTEIALDGGKVWGVLSIQALVPKYEETQGKALVDAAVTHEVEFFVYSSVDRGGEQRSFTNPTNVPHFTTKHHIEQHLLAACSSKGGTMRWVILRPVAFMENLVPGFGAKVMATAWRTVIGQKKPLQLVSTRDIGWFAAQAFLKPEDYAGRSISVAGDELTFRQADTVFQKSVGHGMPQTWSFLTCLIMSLASDLGSMIRWFAAEGYGSDIDALRAEHPELLSFADWLKESEWADRSI